MSPLETALGSALTTVTGALVWAILEIKALNNARLQDQKSATDALLSMSDKTHAALDKVAEVLEAVRHQPAQPYPPSQTGMRSPRSPGGE